MRRRRAGAGRHRNHVEPSAEAQAAMKTDYPEAVKLRLRLLARGGRAVRQVCLVCGRRGEFSEVWIPSAVLQPVPDVDARPQAYWTCRQCHADPPPDERLVELLARRQR